MFSMQPAFTEHLLYARQTLGKIQRRAEKRRNDILIWASKDEFRRQKRGLGLKQAESSLVACVRVLITLMSRGVY